MKSTGELSVIGDFTMKEGVVNMNPNDGFDLGLMNTSYPVYLYLGITVEELHAGNKDRIQGTVNLKNECRPGTIEINLKSWEKIGKPKKVRLHYDDATLLVSKSRPQ